jgi:hypothetical protein
LLGNLPLDLLLSGWPSPTLQPGLVVLHIQATFALHTEATLAQLLRPQGSQVEVGASTFLLLGPLAVITSMLPWLLSHLAPFINRPAGPQLESSGGVGVQC